MYTHARGRKLAHPWEGKTEPFKMVGNLYFTGTYQGSTHIIDTGDGLILIDPAYSKTLYLVIDGIYKLGFSPKDIKYIINTHWHGDHVEATDALADLSGAKTLIGEADAPYLEEKGYFTPDILVKDGDVLKLGNTEITFMHTPGHTKGTLSFFFDIEEGGKTYRAGMFGGAGANALTNTFSTYYVGARRDYFASIEKLRGEKVEIMIGNHTWNNDTLGKGELLRKGCMENPFIDKECGEWNRFLDFCEGRCRNLEEKEGAEDVNA